MSYTKLMITGQVDEVTLTDYVLSQIDVGILDVEHPVKQDLAQIIYATDGYLYPLIMVSTTRLIEQAADLSALRALNPDKESDSFDMIRFSSDESWIVDTYLPAIATEIVQRMQAYMKTFYNPLQITEVWDDEGGGVKTEDNTLGEHYIFLSKFPNTWPPLMINSLTITLRDLLAQNILLYYWLAKGYMEMEKIQRMRVLELNQTLKSIISRRAKATKRRSNLFT